MSYFLFGTFEAMYNKEILRQMKEYGKEKGIYIWFDEEITFYKDIQSMLIEQNAKGDINFAITSVHQPRNSSDILFPFDKFDNEVLFADKTREFFKKCCRDNISILFEYLKKVISLFDIKHWEIFVVEGYDDMFEKKICSIDEMEKDLLHQIQNNTSIDSCIYYIN